jgi:hypothetical protein
MTIKARDDKDLCMSLMARPAWSEVPSTIWLGFLQLHDWQSHSLLQLGLLE